MLLAGSIAAVAVITNNPVLVVGAMIVSPDYGPMAGLSVAVVNRAYGQAWQSFRALALGFPMAALAAFLLTLAARWLGRIPAPYLAGERPLTGLLIGANVGALVGVLVSITTIPAASNVGVAVAMGNLPEAGRSLSILLVNLAGLLIGGVLTLLVTRVGHAGSRRDGRSSARTAALGEITFWCFSCCWFWRGGQWAREEGEHAEQDQGDVGPALAA